ncbi:penicillin-binding protein activator [Rubrimonas cliftonensis]|uniref:penicillin-binding protein activator n=1 Tax=Rubrimonas cliftonensis TaxID=89524 RepID=UPI0015877941|nr:penicillin-binding protein activator [Rubrimonas cliftonensis]
MRAAVVSVTRFLAGLCACVALAACAPRPAPTTTGAAGAAPSQAAVSERRVDVSQPLLIGVLAPLSGSDTRATAFGADLVAAADMAAREKGVGLVRLSSFDTGANAATAAIAARSAIDAGAVALVGPAFAIAARSVANLVAETGTTTLSFTPDSASGSVPLWVIGELPEDDADRIVGYAASTGVRSIAIVFPENLYGQVASAALRDSARRHNVRVGYEFSYQYSPDGIAAAVESNAAAVRASNVEAIVIPDGGLALISVVSFLDYYDVSPRKLQFMGMGLWNTPEVIRERSMRGGLFAAPDMAARRNFGERFAAVTGRQPDPRAYLGYDAVAALVDLVSEARVAGSAEPFSIERMTRQRGFIGPGGTFRLKTDGTNVRPRAIYEVTGDGFALRDPAPAGAPGS